MKVKPLKIIKQGSPPLTREKLTGVTCVTRHSGITPAYAGKTYDLMLYSDLAWDHPRLRGKN